MHLSLCQVIVLLLQSIQFLFRITFRLATFCQPE